MAGLKTTIFLVVIAVSFQFSYGATIPEELAAAESTAMYGVDNTGGGLTILNPVKTALAELGSQQPAYRQWVDGLYKTAMDLLNMFSGFAPYLSKLVNPIVKTMAQVLEKGTTYVADYVRSLPPETVQNVQIKALEFVRKLINMNLVRALIRLLLQALI